MTGFLSSANPRPAPTPLQALWRRPDIEMALADSRSREALSADLRAAAGGAWSAALDLLDSLDGFGRADEAAAGGIPARSLPDSFATDLLATAVFAEALSGDETARRAIDDMRRQRGAAAIAWTGLFPQGPSETAEGDLACEIAALRP